MALSQREKILLMIPVCLGAVIAVYSYVHEPLFSRRAELQSTSSQVETELARHQRMLAQEGDLRARLTKVESREQVIDAWVPGKNSAAMLIYELARAERSTGSTIRAIKVSERREVEAVPQEQQESQASAVRLTQITLDLTIDGMFTQQLRFHQMLERMNLFLNTGAFSMERKEETPLMRISELVKEGAPFDAKLLDSHPELSGTFQLHLYFKSDKQGHPPTSSMQFQTQPGREDPFAWDAVEEFIRTLLDYYAGRYNPDGGEVRVEDGRSQQLG